MSQSRSEEYQNKKLSIMQSLFSGSVAGGLEVLVNHPLFTIKTRLQSPKENPLHFTLNPRVLYRGLLPNAASEIPITAIQLGLNRGFQQHVFDSDNLSTGQSLFSAFVAGIGSAFISCPTERIMTVQGTLKSSFYRTGSVLFRENGIRNLYAGLPVTGMREGLFTAFFLGVTPIIKTYAKPYFSNDEVGTIAAGILSGTCATVVSQPFDRVKTLQQSPNQTSSVTFKNAVKKVYSENGVLGFFKGGVPRGIRVASAVTLMSLVTDSLKEPILKYGAKNME